MDRNKCCSVSEMMEIVSTLWKLAVFSFILSGMSSANNVCLKESTFGFPVVHMCKNETLTKVENIFIDAFVSTSKATMCHCNLQATDSVNIIISMTSVPTDPCDSQMIAIIGNSAQAYSCGYSDTGTALRIDIESHHSISLVLKTVNNPQKDATYCLNLVKTGGSGILSIQCFPPYDVTIPAITTTPESPGSEHQVSDDSKFPVAAVAGGAASAMLIVVVVIIVIVVFIKRKRSRKNEDDSNENGGYDTVNDDLSTATPTNNTRDYQETQNQRTICDYPFDPYSSIDDEPSSVPERARTQHSDFSVARTETTTTVNPATSSDEAKIESQSKDISTMYAKVNKKKPSTTEDKNNESVAQLNDVYTVVDKSKKKTTKAEETGDVYAVVQKNKKSSPKPPPGTPGIIYSDLAFDEDEEEIEGAVGGEDKSGVVSTKEDSVTYSTVSVP